MGYYFFSFTMKYLIFRFTLIKKIWGGQKNKHFTKILWRPDDFKWKNVREKIYILAKDIDSERKFVIKVKTKFCLKKAYFWVHPNLSSWSRIAWIFFLQNVHLITKYLLPEKNSLLTDIWEGGRGFSHRIFSLVKGSAF